MIIRKKTMVLGLLVFFGCLVGASFVAIPSTFAAERTLKFAHNMSSEHPFHKAAVVFANVVREKTEGRLELRVYSGMQLGTEKQIMEGLMIGSIEMGKVGGNVVEGFAPIGSLLYLPYIIRDFDHAFHVEDGPVGEKMKAEVFKKTGVRTLGFNFSGIRSVLSRDKPIRTIVDFKGLKIRVPESPIMISTFKYLGANPTPVPWGELYTAFQTKVVDACESPPRTLADAKLFEIGEFLTLTNHIYSNLFVMINEKFWQSLSEKDKAIFIAGAKADQDFERKLASKLHTETLERIKREGRITVIEIDNKPLQKAVQPLYEEYSKKIGAGGMEIIEQVIKTQ